MNCVLQGERGDARILFGLERNTAAWREDLDCAEGHDSRGRELSLLLFLRFHSHLAVIPVDVLLRLSVKMCACFAHRTTLLRPRVPMSGGLLCILGA